MSENKLGGVNDGGLPDPERTIHARSERRCSNCGTTIPAGEEFCPKCTDGFEERRKPDVQGKRVAIKKLEWEYCVPASLISSVIYGLVASAIFVRTNVQSADNMAIGIAVPALFGAGLFSMLWFSHPGLLIAVGLGLLFYSINHKEGWYYFGMFLTMVVALELARLVWGKTKED